MAPNFFRVLLAIVAVYAFLRGSRDERQIGVFLVVGVIATTLALSPVNKRFSEPGIVGDDCRHRRIRGLFVGRASIREILAAVDRRPSTDDDSRPRAQSHRRPPFSRAYGAALMFWGYPIVLILAIGTWRGQRRQLRANRL